MGGGIKISCLISTSFAAQIMWHLFRASAVLLLFLPMFVGSPTNAQTNDDRVVQMNFDYRTIRELGPEGSGFVVIRVHVEIEGGPNSTSSPLTINYSVAGSASMGEDYTINGYTEKECTPYTPPSTPSTCSVKLPKNDHSRSSGLITIHVNADDRKEEDETIEFTLLKGKGYTLNDYKTTTITIIDDDGTPPPPRTPVVSITDGGNITEGGTASFTLTASPAPANTISVNVSVVDSGDFASSSQTGTRTVTIGTSGTGTLPVTTVNDSTDETNGTLTATVVSGQSYTPSSSQGSASVTVTDDDPPPPGTPVVSITDGGNITEGGTASFTLTASPAPASPITVNVSVVDSGDFASSSQTGTRTVTIGTSGTGTLPVTTVNDSTDETNGTLTATVVSGQSYTPSSSQGSASVTVTDDDPPPPGTPVVSITDGGNITEGGTASFTLTASPAPASPITVNVSVVDSGDFASSSQTGTRTVTIDTSGTGTLPVTTVNDSTDETNGTLTATVVSGQSYTPSSSQGSASVTVTDDDPPPPGTPVVSITDGGNITEGGTASFTLTASPAPASPITVNVSVVDSGDFASSSQTGTRTVTIGTSGTGTLPVTTVNDSTDETNGTLTATVVSGQSYTPSSSQGSASVTVTDDDRTGEPTIDPKEPRIEFSRKSPLLLGEGSTETYSVKLNPKPSDLMSVSIEVNPATESDIKIDPTSFNLDSDNNYEQTITLSAPEDENKVSERIRLNHMYDGDTYTLNVTIKDNDIPPSESVGAGLVRFGRTVGEQSVSAIATRISAERAPSFQGKIAGFKLPEKICEDKIVNKFGALDPP